MQKVTEQVISAALNNDPSIRKEAAQQALEILAGQKVPDKKSALLSIRDACQFLGGLSRYTLFRIAKAGDIAIVRIRGRVFFAVTDLDKYIARRRVTNAA